MAVDPNKIAIGFKQYQSDFINDWCAGCGDHGILRALQKAMAEMALAADQTVVFGGIGCSGKTPYYLRTNAVHTLHGRVLSFAAGAKLANPQLTVIAIGGDGDGLSIGAGHFVNSGRRNLDMTYILCNNGVYGLTKGQPAPTLRIGEQTKSMSQRNIQAHINPALLALVSGYTWVGRGYAYDVPALTDLLSKAIRHPGIAFLEVLQPCPKYNDLHTKQWYSERLYALEDEGHPALIDADCDDAAAQAIRNRAMTVAQQWGQRIPVGVLLQDISSSGFQTQLARLQPACAQNPPYRQASDVQGANVSVDLGPLFDQLKV